MLSRLSTLSTAIRPAGKLFSSPTISSPIRRYNGRSWAPSVMDDFPLEVVAAITGVSAYASYEIYQTVTVEDYSPPKPAMTFTLALMSAASGFFICSTFPVGPIIAGLLATPYYVAEQKKPDRQMEKDNP